MTAKDIELAVANYFGFRNNVIVPNISWGMFLHECDLLILNKQNYAIEVEIKISKADLKKDLTKKHMHRSNKLRRLFFAIPEELDKPETTDYIPAVAGILVIYDVTEKYKQFQKLATEKVFKCEMKRYAKVNKHATQFHDSDRADLGRLGMMRYWNLRNKLKSE